MEEPVRFVSYGKKQNLHRLTGELLDRARYILSEG